MAIARRMGLPSDVIECAERLQPTEARSLEAVLADLVSLPAVTGAPRAPAERRKQATIDAGDATAFPPTPTTDIDARPRFKDDPGTMKTKVVTFDVEGQGPLCVLVHGWPEPM